MTFEERKEQVKSYLGKSVVIKIDRPIGFVHQKGEYSITYPVNYGFIPGLFGGDGEELDVYLLGVNEPVDKYTARIIGIIYRENDVEDKLIAVPDGTNITKEEVEKSTHFQEQFFDTHIEMLDASIYNCTARHCKINGLPQEILDEYKSRDAISLYLGDDRFILRTLDDFFAWIRNLEQVLEDYQIRTIYANTEQLRGEHGIFRALYHSMKRHHPEITSDVIFHLEIATYQNKMEIKVVKMEN